MGTPDVSRDALHMTATLRTKHRSGRTIYAQLGPEPADGDPPVATADSPVLAERIVRAVNAAPPVLAEIRKVVEHHGGTWRADDPALAVDNAIEAEKEKAGQRVEVIEREAAELRRGVLGLLRPLFPPFADNDHIVAALRARLHGDGVVDAGIVDPGSENYRAGHWDALYNVALLLGYTVDGARVVTPREVGEAIRTLRLSRDRCTSCPWPRETACGGAEGVCPGNLIPPVEDALDLPGGES